MVNSNRNQNEFDFLKLNFKKKFSNLKRWINCQSFFILIKNFNIQTYTSDALYKNHVKILPSLFIIKLSPPLYVIFPQVIIQSYAHPTINCIDGLGVEVKWLDQDRTKKGLCLCRLPIWSHATKMWSINIIIWKTLI